MALSFKGGVHPEDRKEATRSKPLEPMTAPATVVLPMNMHTGSPCEPVVAVGDTVFLGQKVAESSDADGSVIHSPVSGTVAAIEPRLSPKGTMVTAIVIDNDFFDTPDPSIGPRGTLERLSADAITDIIREAGIVGLGGAGYPTHRKIRASIGKVDTLIINCVECEPYLTAGYREMVEHPEAIIGGVRLVMKALGLTEAVLAVEANSLAAAEQLEKQIAVEGVTGALRVSVLKTKYPLGGEKLLIKALTGREVPPGKQPAAVGCAVFNSGTCAAVWRAVTTGLPLVTCNVTVSGSAVANPKNLICRVGTPVGSLFAAAGGFREQPEQLLCGGPMMGTALYTVDLPAVKTMGGLLAFSRGESRFSAAPACIRCGRCIKACPMRLMPVHIYRSYEKEDAAALEKLHVNDCMECGSCAYICPGRLPLTQICQAAKRLAADKQREEEAR